MENQQLLIAGDEAFINQVANAIEEAATEVSFKKTHNIWEAFQLLQQGYFRYVILDISLKNQTGVMLLQVIRQDYPDCTVLARVPGDDGFYNRLFTQLRPDYYWRTIPQLIQLLSPLCSISLKAI